MNEYKKDLAVFCLGGICFVGGLIVGMLIGESIAMKKSIIRESLVNNDIMERLEREVE